MINSTAYTGVLAPKEIVISSAWEQQEGFREKRMAEPGGFFVSLRKTSYVAQARLQLTEC